MEDAATNDKHPRSLSTQLPWEGRGRRPRKNTPESRNRRDVADSLPEADSANTDPGPAGGLQLLLTRDAGPHALGKERTRPHRRLFPLEECGPQPHGSQDVPKQQELRRRSLIAAPPPQVSLACGLSSEGAGPQFQLLRGSGSWLMPRQEENTAKLSLEPLEIVSAEPPVTAFWHFPPHAENSKLPEARALLEIGNIQGLPERSSD
ncbi:unnamed protein product [Rangifer tarandus platyrhynchus]|uniref:Uncharacterized protein n=1 Tax=Rangifer tarandus platyrhynchus TaxID=3082113 RepID=A0ABN8ZD90_RANTA|nr:unnamed protein product [Rangifer tarandus platyrhynchus]